MKIEMNLISHFEVYLVQLLTIHENRGANCLPPHLKPETK